MGAFAGLRDAKTYEQGSYLSEGRYTLKICKSLVKDTRKSGSAFIVEAEILASTNPACPVGSKGTWFQGLKDKDVAFGAIKQFLYAVVGLDPSNDADKKTIKDEIDPNIEDLMDEAVTTNSLAGETVNVEVKNKLTKAGKNFSQHNWQVHAKSKKSK